MPIIPGRPKGGTTTSDQGAPRNIGHGGIDDLDASKAPKKDFDTSRPVEADDEEN